MNYMGIKIGDKVKTLRELKNGVNIIPVGSVGTVRKRYAGLEIYFEQRCPACKFGERVWINRVEPRSVEPVKDVSSVDASSKDADRKKGLEKVTK